MASDKFCPSDNLDDKWIQIFHKPRRTHFDLSLANLIFTSSKLVPRTAVRYLYGKNFFQSTNISLERQLYNKFHLQVRVQIRVWSPEPARLHSRGAPCHGRPSAPCQEGRWSLIRHCWKYFLKTIVVVTSRKSKCCVNYGDLSESGVWQEVVSRILASASSCQAALAPSSLSYNLYHPLPVLCLAHHNAPHMPLLLLHSWGLWNFNAPKNAQYFRNLV